MEAMSNNVTMASTHLADGSSDGPVPMSNRTNMETHLAARTHSIGALPRAQDVLR